MKGIINGKLITEDGIEGEKVLLFDKKIIAIIGKKRLDRLKIKGKLLDIEFIDAKGKYIAPGFIDLHIHGAGGCDTMDGSLEALKCISNTICRKGVTAFLPTTMTVQKEKIYQTLDSIREAMNFNIGGARILGAHMEGPFISEKYKGAQKESYIIKPSFDFIKEYLDVIKIITMAPEKDKGYEFIKKVKEESNIVLSIGHSDAKYEEALLAIENGICHSTHIFNAMNPLNHRKPGIVGAIFNSNVSCELIADKIHIHPAIFQILIKTKGIGKVVLITDCMRAGGMENGIYELGGQQVIVDDKAARLRDGTLAGSILDLKTAVQNIMENMELKIHEAISMASLNPAKVLGIEETKGSLKVGKDADILLLDETLEVYSTIVEGETVFYR